MKMTHNWRWYYAAEEITQRLLEGGLIQEEDVLKIRGIIQIVLEEGGGPYSPFLG